MGNASIFEPVKFFSEQERIGANTEITDHIVQILFAFFADTEDGLGDDDEFNGFVDSLTDIACLVMAVAGMEVIGENSDGKIVAKFNPMASMSDFANKYNIS
jgi:hypothetical protein